MVCTKRLSAVGMFVALALGIAGCGSGSADPKASAPGKGKLQTVRVAETAGVPALFIEYGVEQGFFRDRGLDVKVDSSAGGAAALPALVSGEIDIAGSNMVSVMTAATKGLPLTMVAGGSVSAAGEDDWSGMVVGAQSTIKTFGDLAGKRVAINTLRNVNDIIISAVVEREGGDPKSIEFIELPFPDMAAAVARGDVAAALLGEPFLTQAMLKAGVKRMSAAYSSLKPNLQIGTFAATTKFADSHPDVIDAFQAGLQQTAETISKDQRAFRDALPALGEFDPSLANEIGLPAWTGVIDRDSVELLGGLMAKYGVVAKEPDYDKLIRE
jgi:ABC-type nitrate/sulfonate/bicarbonate transport system substrate-binding protein